MCTALNVTGSQHLFGRNLDLDCSYGEQICITPRNCPFVFRKMGQMPSHYAMIGMAAVVEGMPLYYDAANEHGLCMAGLNFPGNACYYPEKEGMDNVTPFELIPWILGRCKTVAEARKLLNRLNLADISFSPALPLSPLHWIISDREQSIVLETVKDGMQIYEAPAGVLSNNPPYPYQQFQLNNYRSLNAATPENTFGRQELAVYCQGLGALGLPGDVSSMSRFVRMAFNAQNARWQQEELADVGQLFHLLGSVEMIDGCCRTDSGHWDTTVYSSCIHGSSGRYYYTTYGNRQISCVDLHKADLEGKALYTYPLKKEQSVAYHN